MSPGWRESPAPVCVSGAALVQTDRLQVGAHGTPASPRGGGELLAQPPRRPPTSPSRRSPSPCAGLMAATAAVAQKLGTARLHVSRLPRLPSSLTHGRPPTPCPCAHSGQPRDPRLPSQGEPRPSETNDASSLRNPSRRPSRWRQACWWRSDRVLLGSQVRPAGIQEGGGGSSGT